MSEQDRLAARADDAFHRCFGRAPQVAARAPGRVNLIGEHTDYNDGLVLPCAIDRGTVALAAPRGDGTLRVRSLDAEGEACFALGALARTGEWSDYVRAPVFALAAAGHRAVGADLLVASDVPIGAGLSSSAALGVAVTLAVAELAGLALSRRAVAEVAHRGESEFVGVGCGILDPFASALGERDHALRIDCRTREVRLLPLPKSALWLVADSGARRELAQSGYRERVAECAAALAAAKRANLAPPDARALRDLAPDALPRLSRALPEPLARRARHVLTENERVDALAAALAGGDFATAGGCLRASQASLRDDYAVSTGALDALCAAADAVPGCHGSRLTGGGFGGCTLHLVVPEVAARVEGALATAGAARVWRVRASDGARLLTLG